MHPEWDWEPGEVEASACNLSKVLGLYFNPPLAWSAAIAVWRVYSSMVPGYFS
jgi:hypothetical protein